MSGVTISALIKKMNLELLTKEINTDKIKLYHPDVNRPALQLAGYYEHFDRERVQLIGVVEYTYMQRMTEEQRLENYEKLLSSEIPCIIFSTNNRPGETFLKIASKYKVPVMLSDKKTSPLMAEIIRWLNVELAPTISIHGVLVDVYGEGVLITGESGIGKSEAALELIKRGHRLVSDDVVEIRKVSDETLVGSAPDITRHFIELRGIGIIDVKTLFGVEAVKNTQAIDMVINLEDWDKDKEYDRFPEDMREAAREAYETFLHTRDGQLADIIVDRAALDAIKKAGERSKEEIVRQYAESTVAVADIRIAVRACKTGKSSDFMKKAMAECDTLDKERLIHAAVSGMDQIMGYLAETKYGDGALALAESASAFERWCDNQIMETIRPQLYNSFSLGPLVAYVLARENEIKTVRIILTGKRSGLPEEFIRERAREMYV